MKIAVIAPGRDISEWSKYLQRYSGTKPQIWPDIDNPELVELAIAWNPPTGELAKLPNLALISSMGAGVDHIVSDNRLPQHVPVVRIVDDGLSTDMSNFILMAVLNFQRQTFRHYENQKHKEWDKEKSPNPKMHVGVLGLGVLGQAAAKALSSRGFKVYGFSKRLKELPNVNCFTGDNGLKELMGQMDVLVNLLPLTSQTKGFLAMPLFQMAQKPFFLINVARGGHLNEKDLMEALNRGIIKGAYLDVFDQEPLPVNSPLWNHKNIVITPHIASITDPSTIVAQIMNNFERVKTGQTLYNQIDFQNEY